MQDLVIKTWGKWDEEWQKDYLKKKFRPKDYQIILVNNVAVGTLVVLEKDGKLELDLIELMPEFQGLGIGTAILHELILHSKKIKKSLCLSVLKDNKQAQKLYKKNGFDITHENDERYFMCLC